MTSASAPETSAADESTSDPTSDATSASAATSDDSSSPATGDNTSQSGTDSSASVAFDDVTTEWFGTMCTGLSPLADQKRIRYDSAGASVEAQRKTDSELYSKTSDVVGTLAETLSTLPPPTIDGGNIVAPAIVTGFRAMSEEAGKQADLINAATDADSLTKALDTANEKTGAALDAIGPVVQKVMTKPGVREALAKVPSCEPLFGK